MAGIDPQQELFIAIRSGIKETLGYDVYDGALPPEETPYPFVYMDNFQQTDDANKTAVFGNVYPTIHVWHDNPKRRGTVSEMLLKIKTLCRSIEKTANFTWDLRNIDQRIINDTTTKAPLMHGVIDLEYKFS